MGVGTGVEVGMGVEVGCSAGGEDDGATGMVGERLVDVAAGSDVGPTVTAGGGVGRLIRLCATHPTPQASAPRNTSAITSTRI